MQRTLGSTEIRHFGSRRDLVPGSRTDDICGALWCDHGDRTAYGGISADDSAAKEKTYAVVGKFLQEFKARNRSATCMGLLGYNVSDPQHVAEAKKNKAVIARRPAFFRDAVKLVEKAV